MTTSALRRQVKNIVHNYSEAEIKVREATSNDPWGPSSSLMSEISDLTFNVVAFAEVMGMIWKRLNDHGKNWRHVYKALTLLDYLVKTGSERVAQQCRENAFTIQTLRDFQYVDRDGKDQGVNVREKAKQLVSLMRDDERLRAERAQALKTKERMAGACSGMGSGSAALPPSYPGRRTSQPSMALQLSQTLFTTSPTMPPFNPPLQPAPPPPVALEMDEDTQLQIALSLSREEHEQEQRSRQGDESMLQKVLEESRRESESGAGEVRDHTAYVPERGAVDPTASAMRDLVDIFGSAPEAPANDDPWEVQPSNLVTSDPWDSVVVARSSTPVIGSPWMAPPTCSSPAHPWGPSHSPPDPWRDLPVEPSPNPGSQAWSSPADAGAPGVDPFSAPAEGFKETEGPPQLFTPRSGSPADTDPFGERVSGGQVNGRAGGSPELFDLSRLGETLSVPSPRACRTPEAFLGPTAASLVNLDTLIPSNPPAKSKNPFLSEPQVEQNPGPACRRVSLTTHNALGGGGPTKANM
ncbi:epsin-3-like [Scleropages formosus]|uniref:Epsin-3-like n=1 Tax=Scleropages formosus TaxID=113540 RepID=A0A0N8JY34_SCLFO|nr:epsin-3-like [Scleropages formosus]